MAKFTTDSAIEAPEIKQEIIRIITRDGLIDKLLLLDAHSTVGDAVLG